MTVRRAAAALAVVVALGLVAGCRGKKAGRARAADDAAVEQDYGGIVDRAFGIEVWSDGGSPEFVGAAEQADLRAWVEARLTADAGRQCRRPVLHGKPLAGPATDDASAVLRHDGGPLAGCYQYFTEHKDALLAALQLPDQAGHPTTRHYRPLDDPASRTDETAELARRCQALPELLSRAVGHEDSCSIYLLGHPSAIDPGGYVDLGWIAVLQGRELARAGKLRQAVELALDQIRLGQDLARGEVGMVELMAGQTGVILELRHVELLLEQSRGLGARQLGAIAGELDRLLESQVDPADALANEPYGFLSYAVLPAVVEPGWRPTGGWGYQGEPVRQAKATTGARQGLLLAGLAARELAADHAARCPAGATMRRCLDGVVELAHQLAGAEPLSMTPTRDGVADLLRRKIVTEATLPAVREALVAQDKAMFDEPRTVGYLRRRAFAEAGLMALRLLVEYRRQALANGKCPELADFASPPLLGLRERKSFGGKLTVETREPGTITVLAPAWVDYKSNPPVPVPMVDLRCRRQHER